MMTFHRIIVAAVAAGTAGCASKPASSTGTPTPDASAAASASSSPGRWSGSFKQTQMPGSQLGAAVPNRGFGTITIAPLNTGPDQVRIELNVSTPVTGGQQIAWALFTGACGSASPMVTGENRFPPLEVRGSGQGYVRVDLQLPLDARAAYHANVYWTLRARDLGDVMMCAPLKYEPRR
jgi:hypothetical protein